MKKKKTKRIPKIKSVKKSIKKKHKPRLDEFKEPVHKEIHIIGTPKIKEEQLDIKKLNLALSTIKKLIKSRKLDQAEKIFYNTVRYYNKNLNTVSDKDQFFIYHDLVKAKQEISITKIKEAL